MAALTLKGVQVRFTQRIGIKPLEKLVQRESIDDDLRNSMWSACTLIYWDRVQYKASRYGETKHSNLYDVVLGLWLHFFKQPVDQIPQYYRDVLSDIRDWYFSAYWGDCYDFIDFLAKNGPQRQNDEFIEIINAYLERENSAYRFVSGELAEITSQEEIESVEQAISCCHEGVKAHLKSALTLMNDKQNPDYRNSIKESISAVESMAKIVTGEDKATLGQTLKIIEKDGNLHQALKTAFSSLYGYTNDAEGIRHALLEESTLKKSDAKFMLVSCSAFVNYLIELGAN